MFGAHTCLHVSYTVFITNVHICFMVFILIFHICILSIDVFTVILGLIPEVKEANSNHYLTAAGICSNQEWNQACSDYTEIMAGLSPTIINCFLLEKRIMGQFNMMIIISNLYKMPTGIYPHKNISQQCLNYYFFLSHTISVSWMS